MRFWQPVVVAARPADGDAQVGVGRSEARGGFDEDVEALPRHEPAQADHEIRVLVDAVLPSGPVALVLAGGRSEPIRVHARAG